MRALLRQILTHDPRAIEVLHAAFLTAWTLVLLIPSPTFSTSLSYAAMAETGPEGIWALASLLTLGIVGLGLVRKRAAWRRAGSMIGVLWWGTVAVHMVLSNPAGTGGWVYLVFAQFLGWAYIAARE